jgi:MFS family permease
MQLILPDILAEARHFSVAFGITAFAVGLVVWLFGWWGHRFWIVLVTTVAAGVWGLYFRPPGGAQPLAVGLLLAVTAGLLALAVVRLLSFAAGGLAACLLLRALLPDWDEPAIGFMAGGLLGLLLFRLWTMGLTSLAGALLMTYAVLSVGDRLGQLDALAWAEGRAVLLNWCCGGLAAVGLVAQFVLDRWRVRRERWQTERALAHLSDKDLRHIDTLLRRRAWWGWRPRPRPRQVA